MRPLGWSQVARFVEQQTPESVSLDFKREIDAGEEGNHKLRCDAVALANAQGGRLIIGIADGGGKAGSFFTIDTAKTEQRAKDVLAGNIEPTLRYELYAVRNPEKQTEGVVVIEVEDGREVHCVAKKPDALREFWIRRADSNRAMSAADIRQRHTEKNPAVTEALTALGIWELRRQPRFIGPTFELDPDRLREHIAAVRSVCRDCNNAPMVAAEVSTRLEDEFTEAIRRGGWLENYREVTSEFENDLEFALGQSTFEGPLRYIFERAVWFGEMLSYQASVRLVAPENRLLIALAARLLGLAVWSANKRGNDDARKIAAAVLIDQRQYYRSDAELLECFDYALAGRASHRWRDDDDAPALFFRVDTYPLDNPERHLFIDSKMSERPRGSLRRTWRIRLRWKLAELRTGWRYKLRPSFKRRLKKRR